MSNLPDDLKVEVISIDGRTVLLSKKELQRLDPSTLLAMRNITTTRLGNSAAGTRLLKEIVGS